MRSPEEIEAKIAELREEAYGPATRMREARRDQIHALAWALGENEDGRLDWIEHAMEQLGPEARELFPSTAAAIREARPSRLDLYALALDALGLALEMTVDSQKSEPRGRNAL
jgi:hypothetical protein